MSFLLACACFRFLLQRILLSLKDLCWDCHFYKIRS
jgi:hypothetical protein